MFVPISNTVVAGRYELIDEIGRGGMGVVWRARQTNLGVECAVKFIHESLAHEPDVRRRFVREARAAASLKSPHSVHILDVDEWQGTLFIAMELLGGEALDARLNREGALSLELTLEVVEQVARGLNKAHAAGLVHRDLKPENIFIVDEDPLLVKILDFGIAKRVGAASGLSTTSGVLIGTPGYMSPEQADGGKEVDFRSDLWSLAVVAFRCLTGVAPFEADGVGQVLLKVMTAPIPAPRSLRPGLPASVDDWWFRVIQRDPAQRPASARALASGLRAALAQGTNGAVVASGAASHPTTLPATPMTPAMPAMPAQPAPVEARTPQTPSREAVAHRELASREPARHEPAPRDAQGQRATLQPVSSHPGRRGLPSWRHAAGGAAVLAMVGLLIATRWATSADTEHAHPEMTRQGLALEPGPTATAGRASPSPPPSPLVAGERSVRAEAGASTLTETTTVALEPAALEPAAIESLVLAPARAPEATRAEKAARTAEAPRTADVPLAAGATRSADAPRAAPASRAKRRPSGTAARAASTPTRTRASTPARESRESRASRSSPRPSPAAATAAPAATAGMGASSSAAAERPRAALPRPAPAPTPSTPDPRLGF